MPRIPVVGTRGLHVAQLSPKVRRILKQRADNAARRAYAPEVAADKAAIGSVRKGFQNERQSIMGATDMAQNSLSQALRGLKSSGLQGRYLKQAVSELTARQGDIAGSVPFLLSDAAQQRNEGLMTARQELTDTRAARGKSGAEAFNQLLKEKRDAASSVLAERADDGLSDSALRSLKNVQFALRDTLAAWHKNVPVEIEVGGEKQEVPFQSANPLKTIDDWRTLAAGLVSEYEGFDASDVMGVIRRTLAKRQKQFGQVRRGERQYNDLAPLVREFPRNVQPLGIRFRASTTGG